MSTFLSQIMEFGNILPNSYYFLYLFDEKKYKTDDFLPRSHLSHFQSQYQ